MKNYLVPAFSYPHKIWPKSEIINQNFVNEKIQRVLIGVGWLSQNHLMFRPIFNLVLIIKSGEHKIV